MKEIIKVMRLSKQFRDILAVDDISFSVAEGDVYGFLGQNGAGKSTSIRMLLTLVQPSAGEIEIFGQSLAPNRRDILRQVGAVVEKPELYKYLSGYENLSLFARLSGKQISQQKLLDQLEMVGLSERANHKVGTYSDGMKQRLGLAVALVHDPGLIILDEPTNGLDPQGIADLRNLIVRLSREQKKTIFISSHQLAEVELIANRMLVLDKGRKIAEGAVQELLDPDNMLLKVELANPDEIMMALDQSDWIRCLKKRDKRQLHFQVAKSQVPSLTAALVQMGAAINSIIPTHTLEAYFLSLTNGNTYVDPVEN